MIFSANETPLDNAIARSSECLRVGTSQILLATHPHRTVRLILRQAGKWLLPPSNWLTALTQIHRVVARHRRVPGRYIATASAALKGRLIAWVERLGHALAPCKLGA